MQGARCLPALPRTLVVSIASAQPQPHSAARSRPEAPSEAVNNRKCRLRLLVLAHRHHRRVHPSPAPSFILSSTGFPHSRSLSLPAVLLRLRTSTSVPRYWTDCRVVLLCCIINVVSPPKGPLSITERPYTTTQHLDTRVLFPQPIPHALLCPSTSMVPPSANGNPQRRRTARGRVRPPGHLRVSQRGHARRYEKRPSALPRKT